MLSRIILLEVVKRWLIDHCDLGNLISINETLLKHLRQMKSLDITQDNEGAVYAIFRFLKSVIDLSDVSGYKLISLVHLIGDSHS